MGSVPVNPQQQQSNPAMDMLNSLTSQRQALQVQQTEALKAAATPIQARAPLSPNVPSPPQFQGAELNHQPTVGAGNARGQGIGNTIIAAMNLVGSFENAAQQKKSKALSNDITNLYSYMDGMDQAKQQLQQNPEDPNAKSMYEKNKTNVDAMLGDDKKRKMIGKALNVNFTDPSANNSPEHKAGADAAKSYAEQLQSKLPTKQAPNVQAQQKAAMIETQMQGVNKAIEDTSKIVTEQFKQENANWRTQYVQQNANQRAQDANQVKLQTDAANNIARHETAIDAAKVRGNYEMMRQRMADTDAHKRLLDGIQKRGDMAASILGDVGPDGSPKAITAKNRANALYGANFRAADAALQKIPDQINKLQQLQEASKSAGSHWFGKNDNQKDVDLYQSQIDALKGDMQVYQGQKTYWKDKMDGKVTANGDSQSQLSQQPSSNQSNNVAASPADDDDTNPDSIQ